MYCWNLDEVRIYETMSAITNINSLTIKGCGIYKSQPFAFQAMVNNLGWYIEFETGLGKRGSWQGNSFNLAAEVATAAKRVL